MTRILDRTVAPPVKSLTKLHLPPVEHLTLDNGARLTLLDAGDHDITQVSVAIDEGLDKSAHKGAGMIAPELAIEGTANYPGEQIADIIDFNGAKLGTKSHTYHVSTTLRSLTSKLDSLLPVLADIIGCPVFPEQSLKAIADRLAAQLAIAQEHVSYQASLGFSKMVKGPDYPTNQIVTPADLTSVTRSGVADYHKRLLDTTRMHIFASGRVNEAVVGLINKTLGQISSTGPGFEIDFRPFSPQAEHTYNYVKPDALQSAITMGWPSISRLDRDYINLRLAVMALGGYFGSRLMKNIREDKGFTYGIGAGLMGGPEGSTIQIMTETDNRFVRQVINEVKAEMEKIKDPSTFDDDEIERLRRFYMSTLASVLDTPFTIMDNYANIVYAGTPADYFDRQQEAIATMSAESIASTARRYFDTDSLYISVAGARC